MTYKMNDSSTLLMDRREDRIEEIHCHSQYRDRHDRICNFCKFSAKNEDPAQDTLMCKLNKVNLHLPRGPSAADKKHLISFRVLQI